MENELKHEKKYIIKTLCETSGKTREQGIHFTAIHFIKISKETNFFKLDCWQNKLRKIKRSYRTP